MSLKTNKTPFASPTQRTAQATAPQVSPSTKPLDTAPVTQQAQVADGGDPTAKAALKALALDVKMEAKQKTRASEATSLGAKLMGAVRSDAGKKAFAALGLGISIMGMAQPASADVVNVAPAQVQSGAQQTATTDAAKSMMDLVAQGAGAGPASSWLADTTGQGTSTTVQPGKLSPQAALIQQKLAATSTAAITGGVTADTTQAAKPDLRLTQDHAKWENTAELRFTVPTEMRQVKNGQSVLVPLEGGRELHMIELRYHDNRPLKDFEFNRRAPGGQWETFRGDEYAAMEAKEKAGELEIKREPDHNAMWVNNPVRVKVDVVNAQGEVLHAIGKKFVDPQLHDAYGPDSPGSAEVDNISNGYEKLPAGKLPEGAFLRLTPFFVDQKPWEAGRDVAMDLSWVKPIYMPDHTERATVRAESTWEKPRAEGYTVEANRPIAAILVKWTDHGGSASGSARLTQPDGTTFQSASSNVGSGETELIPMNGAVSKDGKLHIEGWGIEVGNIEVLYK